MIFINKQPILDVDNAIHSYIIDTPSSQKSVSEQSYNSFINRLLDIGLLHIARDHRVFFRINDSLLTTDALNNFAGEELVLALHCVTTINDELIARVDELRAQGFTFALYYNAHTTQNLSAFESLAKHCEYFIVDLSKYSPQDLEDLQLTFSKLSGTKIAINVHTQLSKQLVKQYGFTLFGGSYYTHPVTVDNETSEQSYLDILDLLNTLEQSHSIDELASRFSASPNITFELLKFLNSPVFGLSKTIKSIRHALMLIGRKDLRKWLLLLALNANADTTEEPSPLMCVAQERISLMEELFKASDTLPSELQTEASFVVVLALMNALIGISYDSLFKTINVSSSIKDAILSYKGQLGELLELCIATEEHDIHRVIELMGMLNITYQAYHASLIKVYQS